MDYRIDGVVKKYADVVNRRFNPLKIYLYGSYTKGNNCENSDIDIAVVIPVTQTNEYMAIFGELFSLAAEIDERIEPNLFIFHDIDDKYSILHEIVTTGVEVSQLLDVSA